MSRTNVVLERDMDINQMRKELAKHSRKAYIGAWQADITDDGRTLQLHWGVGDMTNVCIQELLASYLAAMGVKDDRTAERRRKNGREPVLPLEEIPD